MRSRMNAVGVLPNNLQQASDVNVSDQTIRNRLHESGMRAQRPVVSPLLTPGLIGIERQNWQVHHWYPVLLTDKRRVTMSTCDRCEAVWRRLCCNVVQYDLLQAYSQTSCQCSGSWVPLRGQQYPSCPRFCTQLLEEEGMDTIIQSILVQIIQHDLFSH